jgi:hypothetical protein
MKKINKFGIIVAFVGILIILAPIVFPVCQGLLELISGKKVPMRCVWTARAEYMLGALVLISGLMIAFLKNADSRRRLSHIVGFLGAAVILTPLYIIPTCMDPEMSCNVGTKPALIILGGITLILGLVGSRAPKPELPPTTP